MAITKGMFELDDVLGLREGVEGGWGTMVPELADPSRERN